MERSRRSLVVLIGALALVAIAGATALAGKGLKTKSETVSVASLEPGAAMARCTQGMKAISGGFETEFDPSDNAPFLVPSESRRAGGRGWTSAAVNFSPAESGDLTSFAYCRDQKLKPRSATTTVEGNGEHGSVEAKCKQGQKAFSGSFAVDEQVVGPGGPVLRIAESRRRGGRKWRASALNTGTEEGDLTAYVYCGEGKALRTRTSKETLSSAARSGRHRRGGALASPVSAEASCKRKQRSVSGGFRSPGFETGDVFILASRKLGKRAWKVTAVAGLNTPTSIVAYAYCER